jgi:hypothetical protein
MIDPLIIGGAVVGGLWLLSSQPVSDTYGHEGQ